MEDLVTAIWMLAVFAAMLLCLVLLRNWSNSTAVMKDFDDWLDNKIEKGKIK